MKAMRWTTRGSASLYSQHLTIGECVVGVVEPHGTAPYHKAAVQLWCAIMITCDLM